MIGKPSAIWSATLPVVVGFLTAFVLICGFGLWATNVEIAGAVIAPAQVEVELDRQVVQHLRGGVIDEIIVQEGMRVKSGALLLRLNGETQELERAGLDLQLFKMRVEVAGLVAQVEGAPTVTFPPEIHLTALDDDTKSAMISAQRQQYAAQFTSQQKATAYHQKRMDELGAQITGAEALISAHVKQIELIEMDLRDQKSLLAQGLASARFFRSLQREAARLEGTFAELKSTRSQSKARLSALRLERATHEAKRNADALQRLTDLKQERRRLILQRHMLNREIAALSIRAPVGGVIYGLQVNTPGEVVQPGVPLMYMMPQDRPLIVMAKVAPRDVDEVQQGQRVTLRLSAFNQTLTPEIIGIVHRVSADVAEDRRSGQTYFEAEIRIDDAERERLHSDIMLLPGMPVEALIRTGDRTPLSYLVKPIADYFSRAFRES